jgi:chaperonin GroEL (HSP60 family)
VHGYKSAADEAIRILNEVGVNANIDDRMLLKKIALTSMHSKGVGVAKDHFADIAIEAVKQVAEKRGESYFVDIDNVQLIKKEGKSLLDTELVKGLRK